jgi:hypothetical protein
MAKTMDARKAASPPPEAPGQPRSGRLQVALGVACGLAAGTLITFFVTRSIYRADREPEKNLAAIRQELAGARTLAEDIRAHLIQEYLLVLSRGAQAKEMAYLDYGKKGILELGPRTLPACRELGLRTQSDDLKIQLIGIIGQWKEPEAAGALLDLYLAQNSGRKAVKEAAVSNLAKLGIRQTATCLGKIIREEKDESMKAYIVPYYKPYAHADPQGIPADPKLLQTVQRTDHESDVYSEIHRLDAKNDPDQARLAVIARRDGPSGLRLAAIQKLVLRKDEACVSLLGELIRSPGKDDGGTVRGTSLAHLCRMDLPQASEMLEKILQEKDTGLRMTTLSVLSTSGRKEHLQLLTRFQVGDAAQEEKRMAGEAILKIQALESRTNQDNASPKGK